MHRAISISLSLPHARPGGGGIAAGHPSAQDAKFRCVLAGGTPVLALDMYEHSYHIDFGAGAASYVDTFIDAVRWSNAGRLFSGFVQNSEMPDPRVLNPQLGAMPR